MKHLNRPTQFASEANWLEMSAKSLRLITTVRKGITRSTCEPKYLPSTDAKGTGHRMIIDSILFAAWRMGAEKMNHYSRKTEYSRKTIFIANITEFSQNLAFSWIIPDLTLSKIAKSIRRRHIPNITGLPKSRFWIEIRHQLWAPLI